MNDRTKTQQDAPTEGRFVTEDQVVAYLRGEGPLNGDKLVGDEALDASEIREIEQSVRGGMSGLIEGIAKAGQAAKPSPTELITEERVGQFLRGEISLANLEGMDATVAYGIADVGHMLLGSGRVEDARTIFEGLEVYNPADPYFHAMLGSIYKSLGFNAAARSQFETALGLNSEDVEVLAFLGEMDLQDGEFRRAAERFGKAMKLDAKREHPAAARAAALAAVVRAYLEAPGG